MSENKLGTFAGLVRDLSDLRKQWDQQADDNRTNPENGATESHWVDGEASGLEQAGLDLNSTVCKHIEAYNKGLGEGRGE